VGVSAAVGVGAEKWTGKSAKEIMAGVRGVLGEDRFDVFRAHSGEYRRGEIDGGEYYALFGDDFSLLDEHGLFHPIIDLLPGLGSRV
jgi:hypothetical protein